MAGLFFNVDFGQLFLVEPDDALDRSGAAPKGVAKCQQFLDDNLGARDGLEHAYLAALDAPGDGYLAFPGQQRYGAHLSQVQADRVFGLRRCAWAQVELGVFGLGLFPGLSFREPWFLRARSRSLGAEHIFENLDPIALEGRK